MITRVFLIAQAGMAVALLGFSNRFAEAQSDPANFTTVIHSPPTFIGSFESIGADTQLNVTAGGTIGRHFDAGSPDGSSANIEVNIAGGLVFEHFDAYAGSTINLLGGTVANDFEARTGSKVNISDGVIGDLFQAGSGSVVKVSGGSFVRVFTAFPTSSVEISGGQFGVGFVARAGSSVNISAGTFGILFRVGVVPSPRSIADTNLNEDELDTDSLIGGAMSAETPSTIFYPDFEVNISGGSFGERFQLYENGELNLIGRDFALNGVLIEGLASGVPHFISERNMTLTGLLADGSPFGFDLNATFSADEDWFHPNGTLAVTLAIPEPASGLLLLLVIMVAATCRGKAFSDRECIKSFSNYSRSN